MNFVRIRIALEDREYASTLAKALTDRHSGFLILVGDTADLPGDWDVQLIEADQKINNPVYADDFRVIGMYEEPAEEYREGMIDKFAGVSEIASRLLIAYGNSSEKNRFLKSGLSTEVIGFTGASGGAGVTVTALATARELAVNYSSKVIYISMESIESTGFYFPDDLGQVNLSDYLYYLFSDKEQGKSLDVRAFLLSDFYGVDAFRPSKGINELRELSGDEITAFMKSVTESRPYDYLILDFAVHNWDTTELLCSFCSKLYLVDDSSLLSMYRNEKLHRFLEKKTSEGRSKIVTIHNKWTAERRVPEGVGEMFLEEDEGSFRISDKRIEIDIHHRFGMGVKKIAQQIYRKA